MKSRWRPRPRLQSFGSFLRSRARGAGILEFALASLIFLPLTLGTIDFGRAIYQYSQFENAVREGARFGKTDPTNTAGIQSRITTYGTGITLSSFGTSTSASPCNPGLCQLTVSASFQFNGITTGFLNTVLGGSIPATITISTTATVVVE